MKTYQKLITWCIIFLCFVLFVALLILDVTGTIKISWVWVISPVLIPVLYCACLILYGMWVGYQSNRIKTPDGILKAYDTVVYDPDNTPQFIGYLVKHGSIWVVEYFDGSQIYVEDVNLLKKV